MKISITFIIKSYGQRSMEQSVLGVLSEDRKTPISDLIRINRGSLTMVIKIAKSHTDISSKSTIFSTAMSLVNYSKHQDWLVLRNTY